MASLHDLPPVRSPWLQPRSHLPPLDRNLDVDVAIVGGGITGITAAWLLTQAGQRVALLERGRCGDADTGHTTAHLTYVTDKRLHALVDQFCEEGARAVWEAGAAAIDQIAAIVKETGADCGFRWIPGYLHAPLAGVSAPDNEEVERLRADAELANRLGFDARFVEHVPFHHVPGVHFRDQATFDPGSYLAELLKRIVAAGGLVFEDSPADAVEEEPRRVLCRGHAVRCRFVILATHNPLSGSVGAVRSGLFQTKLSLYTSYVLGARVLPGRIPDALFWDTSDPYEYLRIEPREDHDLVIFGGADTKTGQQDDVHVHRHLESRLRLRLPGVEVQQRWLGQVIETPDGVPYIGEHAPGEFIATGFAGNGMTFGTLAAMMATDAALGHANPWKDLLRVDRKPFHGGVWRYVRENLDYPWYLLRDRLGPAQARSLADVPPGEARIVSLHAGKAAVHRSRSGKLTICSAVCTHLKCLVRWNDADETWDCPCHGSRFSPEGAVLSGPAEEPLKRLEELR